VQRLRDGGAATTSQSGQRDTAADRQSAGPEEAACGSAGLRQRVVVAGAGVPLDESGVQNQRLAQGSRQSRDGQSSLELFV